MHVVALKTSFTRGSCSRMISGLVLSEFFIWVGRYKKVEPLYFKKGIEVFAFKVN